MEGFRPNTKMKSQIACFKEGGSTTPAKREAKRHEKADVAEDKKIVKKAVAQHEGAKHKGEGKTELKLKTGGRAKKEKPSVKRFDSKAIKMKKDDSDKKAIAKVKKTKPVVERMSPAPAAPAPEGMGMGMEDTQDPNMGVEGFAAGRGVGDMSAYMPSNAIGSGAAGAMGAGQAGMASGMGRARRPNPGYQNLPYKPGIREDIQTLPYKPGMGAGQMQNMPYIPQTQEEREALMRGIQAIGNYCGGGKA